MKYLFKKIIVAIVTLEARLVLKRHKPKIIAVTGSVGKTSTKDAIFDVLKGNFKIRKSVKSYNSELGVPLVVLGCENAWFNPLIWLLNMLRGLKSIIYERDYPDWLVLELGVERPGDMSNLMSWVKPRVAVVTAFSEVPVHVEFFASPQALVREKSQILKNLKEDDYAILNTDDDTVYDLKNKTKAKIISYGFGAGADLAASNYHVIEEGITFKLDCDGVSIPVRLFSALGKHHVYSALAALAVGRALGLNFVDMADSLVNYQPPAGRLRLLKGIKSSLILDDSYNSSPMALRAALEAVKELSANRKIVVLGDMLELGKYTIEAHKSMSGYIVDAGAEMVFTVGPRSKFIAEGLREKNFSAEKIFEFSGSDEAKIKIQETIKEGDLILVKGSQSMRMEKIVEEIMAQPEDKGKLLVRQEREWKNKK